MRALGLPSSHPAEAKYGGFDRFSTDTLRESPRLAPHWQLGIPPTSRGESKVRPEYDRAQSLTSGPSTATAQDGETPIAFRAELPEINISGLRFFLVTKPLRKGRAAILYHSNHWSSETLAFELRYHAAYRWFCLLDQHKFPSRSSLHRDIQSIAPETWEEINRLVLGHAVDLGVEDGTPTIPSDEHGQYETPNGKRNESSCIENSSSSPRKRLAMHGALFRLCVSASIRRQHLWQQL